MPKYYRKKDEFGLVQTADIAPYIAAAQTKPDVQCIIALAWLSGCRIQELLNLKRSSIAVSIEKEDVLINNRALKKGKMGYPYFSFSDPFVSDIVLPYLNNIPEADFLFAKSKRAYQQQLLKLNKRLSEDSKNWITFHYLRHSRITFLARILHAYPDEIKAWTGHRSSAFEEYFGPHKTERFKGRLG